ncbi:hemerythrin domain-containing protein [Actinotalea sp. M2MS4P-6]|uniref:hemerythrin domain-containing protein n=1 Tax=Actinotalea sp. M2MS4P-6 TaxID=2983762 RepID=UPI0021E39D26|nr:hemerythrin domain-containing protein [Actinotalea sp. M2MS4P-6]MCV2395153.1 hemerythrin domain-containing protein [Actinotalea sp. M2MS4P-6]
MSAPAQQPPTPTTCNTADMLVVHRVFRHLYADAPDLVRSVPPGDLQRTAVVAAHIRGITLTLHNHHHTEDLLLWDTLEQRSPACALHVSLMRSQHAEVARLIDEADAALPAWEGLAGERDRDAVAEIVAEIRSKLEQHLGQEEERILPVAATSMTQAEWDRLGEHGRASVPKDQQLIQLGWILDALGPEDGATFAREVLPAPVRALWAVLGKRKFAAHKRALYGHA